MPEVRKCDFCGRSENNISIPVKNGSSTIELDVDGLWVCHDCQSKLTLPVVGGGTENSGELHGLVGKSAGAICYTLNLPYEPPYQQVIDAAAKIAYDEDRYMSTWSFVTKWLDGTTLWQSEDGESTVTVTTDGSLHFRSLNHH